MGEELVGSLLGQLLSAGVSLAGLVLVFLGFVVSSFESYEPQERRSVLKQFRTRVWLSFAGLLASIVAGTAGFVGQLGAPHASFWVGSLALAAAAFAVLVLALQVTMGVK